VSDRYIQVPLADELFDCLQGPFQGWIEIDVPGIEFPQKFIYHTYSRVLPGSPDDPDVEATLRSGFETYLRRLREFTSGNGKPKLFWRFRKGECIQIEGEHRRLTGKKKEWRAKLYTRLVVPDCSLNYCLQCLHTEGEPHAIYCENVVGRSQLRG
jgi:hypothetical protein